MSGSKEEHVLRMLEKLRDPQRKQTLHLPLCQRLNETMKEHLERSKISHPGAELTPVEIIDALTTVTASFVVPHTEPGMPPGDVTLNITKMLARKMMKAFSVMEKLNVLFGKEPS